MDIKYAVIKGIVGAGAANIGSKSETQHALFIEAGELTLKKPPQDKLTPISVMDLEDEEVKVLPKKINLQLTDNGIMNPAKTYPELIGTEIVAVGIYILNPPLFRVYGKGVLSIENSRS